MNNLLLGGTDPRTGAPFAYYETLSGGHGAGPHWSGASAMQAHMTNTRNTPIESLEHACPLRVTSMRIRRGSGGEGTHTGGDGIERSLELLADARVTVIAERRARGPYGLVGGENGAPGFTRAARPGETARTLPAKFTLDLPAGSRLTLASPGGGGWGRVATRRSSRAPSPRSGAPRRGGSAASRRSR
jgi:N-methylhydantoinase B